MMLLDANIGSMAKRYPPQKALDGVSEEILNVGFQSASSQSNDAIKWRRFAQPILPREGRP